VIQRQNKIWLVVGSTLTVILFLGCGSSVPAQEQRPFETLMTATDAIVVVEILSTDYTATPAWLRS
jgi:hypothetical protein